MTVPAPPIPNVGWNEEFLLDSQLWILPVEIRDRLLKHNDDDGTCLPYSEEEWANILELYQRERDGGKLDAEVVERINRTRLSRERRQPSVFQEARAFLRRAELRRVRADFCAWAQTRPHPTIRRSVGSRRRRTRRRSSARRSGPRGSTDPPHTSQAPGADTRSLTTTCSLTHPEVTLKPTTCRVSGGPGSAPGVLA